MTRRNLVHWLTLAILTLAIVGSIVYFALDAFEATRSAIFYR